MHNIKDSQNNPTLAVEIFALNSFLYSIRIYNRIGSRANELNIFKLEFKLDFDLVGSNST